MPRPNSKKKALIVTLSVNVSVHTQHLSQQIGKPLPGLSAALSLPMLIQRGLVDNEVLASYLVHAKPQDLMHALHYTWGGPAVPSISPFIEQVASVRTETIGIDHSPEDGALFKSTVSQHVIQYAGFSVRASFASLTANGLKYESVQVCVFARANIAAYGAIDTRASVAAARRQFVSQEPVATLRDSSGKLFDQALSDNAEDHFPAQAPAFRPVHASPEFAIHNRQADALNLQRADRKQVALEETPAPAPAPQANAQNTLAQTRKAERADRKLVALDAEELPIIRANKPALPETAAPSGISAPNFLSRAKKAAKNLAGNVADNLQSAGRSIKQAAQFGQEAIGATSRNLGRKAAQVVKIGVEKWVGAASALAEAVVVGAKHWVDAASAVAQAVVVGAKATGRFLPFAAEVVRSRIEWAGSKAANALGAAAGQAIGVVGTVAALVGNGAAKAAGFVWNRVQSVVSGFQRL